MERLILYPQSLSTEVSWAARRRHNRLRSPRQRHVRRPGEAGARVHLVSVCSSLGFALCLRVWGGPDQPGGYLQFPQPPGLLPPEPAVRVGDPRAGALPGADPCVVSGRGGTFSLSVRLAGGAGAGGAERSRQQVGHRSHGAVRWRFQTRLEKLVHLRQESKSAILSDLWVIFLGRELENCKF